MHCQLCIVYDTAIFFGGGTRVKNSRRVGGLTPWKTGDPRWKRWSKNWRSIFDPLDHACALYSCFKHVLCTFTRGSDGVRGAVEGVECKKNVQACNRSPWLLPPLRWRFNVYAGCGLYCVVGCVLSSWSCCWSLWKFGRRRTAHARSPSTRATTSKSTATRKASSLPNRPTTSRGCDRLPCYFTLINHVQTCCPRTTKIAKCEAYSANR